MMIAGLTCLWDNGDTNSMIKIKHTKHYERKISPDKIEYSTESGMYCTNHDVKVPFCMPEFSRRNIIQHNFHVYNGIGESGIGYAMIIGRNLIIQLDLLVEFKRQVLQWDGVTVHMKEPRVLLRKPYLTSR